MSTTATIGDQLALLLAKGPRRLAVTFWTGNQEIGDVSLFDPRRKVFCLTRPFSQHFFGINEVRAVEASPSESVR